MFDNEVKNHPVHQNIYILIVVYLVSTVKYKKIVEEIENVGLTVAR